MSAVFFNIIQNFGLFRGFLQSRLWQLTWPVAGLALIILVSLYPVVINNRSLLGSPLAAGVMGNDPPYGVTYDEPVTNRHQLDPGASAWQDEPWTEKAAKMYRNGDIPLWNSSQALGKPLAAAMQSAVFYPLKALVFIAPTPLVWNIYLLLRLAIGGVLAFLFFRLIGLKKISSLVGATIFILSGHYLFFVAEAHLNVDIVLPLLFISFELIAQKRKNSWLWLALSVFLMAVGGHPETALLAGTFGLIYFAYRLFIDRDKWLEKAGQALGGIVMGLGLSFFLVLPFFEFMRYAYTIHGPEEVLATIHDPKKMLINLFYPYFFGWPYQPWTDQYGTWSGTRNYIGVTALFLGTLSLFSLKKYYRYTPIFLFLFFVAITKLYGLLNYDWLSSVPYFNAIGYQKYLGPEISFIGGALAALGVNYLFLMDQKRYRPYLLILPAILVSYTIWYLYPSLDLAPERVIEKVKIQLILPATLVLLALAGSFFWFKRRDVIKYIAVIFAVVAIAEMVILAPKHWPKRVEPYNKPPFVQYLQDRGTERLFAVDYLLYPNASSAFGLYDVRDLDAVFVTHYFRYIKEFINPSVVDRYTGMPENASKENLPTTYRNNLFFDLLGIRYIVTKNQAIVEDSSSLARKLVDGIDSANTGIRTLKVGDETRTSVFEHPDTVLSTTVTPRTRDTKLTFSVGIDQSSWGKEGDGATFKIWTTHRGDRSLVYELTVDPRTNSQHREWIDGEVSLGSYAGQTIKLDFETSAGANNLNDLAGWSRLRLTDEPVVNDEQYRLVYEDEVNIYENTHAFPRAFLVGDVTVQPTEDDVVAAMKTTDFNPRLSAVIETDRRLNIEGRSAIPIESVEITSYKDQQVTLNVSAPRKSLLVLSDTYYPGWKAYIDGKEVEIYKTNLALRGVLIEEGEHSVEFAYRPDSFRIGLYISIISLIGALLVFLRKALIKKPVQ